MPDWIAILNHTVLSSYRTRLVGGFDEPFYLAYRSGKPAEIRFTRDYERSALHELAHWCVAGEARRRLDDYGYWYAPDGRSDDQQQAFFRVEVTPQAIERHFCAALGISFAISVDNLGNSAVHGIEAFRTDVEARFNHYARCGLPHRAAAIFRSIQASRTA
jgi:elongation factor P hydroxylase